MPFIYGIMKVYSGCFCADDTGGLHLTKISQIALTK